jgi:hypothetical protein
MVPVHLGQRGHRHHLQAARIVMYVNAGVVAAYHPQSTAEVKSTCRSLGLTRVHISMRPTMSVDYDALPLQSTAEVKLACRSLGLTRVHISMRPTMSVDDTPSVRLISRKRPIFLAYAYASVPSAGRHRATGFSRCRYKILTQRAGQRREEAACEQGTCLVCSLNVQDV